MTSKAESQRELGASDEGDRAVARAPVRIVSVSDCLDCRSAVTVISYSSVVLGIKVAGDHAQGAPKELVPELIAYTRARADIAQR
jgi:hypothetical protein